jgi:hypothetical protein
MNLSERRCSGWVDTQTDCFLVSFDALHRVPNAFLAEKTQKPLGLDYKVTGSKILCANCQN